VISSKDYEYFDTVTLHKCSSFICSNNGLHSAHHTASSLPANLGGYTCTKHLTYHYS